VEDIVGRDIRLELGVVLSGVASSPMLINSRARRLSEMKLASFPLLLRNG
jgi:hypothetical protein